MSAIQHFDRDGSSRDQSPNQGVPLEGVKDGYDPFPRPVPPELCDTGTIPAGHIAYVGDFRTPPGYILLLAGKPASGKSTISRVFIENIVPTELPDVTVAHISVGDRLRDIARGDVFSHHAEDVATYAGQLLQAQPLPHSLVAKVVQEAVFEKDETVVLLDGYPRFEEQLNDYQLLARRVGRKTIGLVEFATSDELVTERLLARPTRVGEQDNNEETIQARLDEYHSTVSRTIAAIIRSSLINYHEISTSGSVEYGAKQLSRIIGLKLTQDTI